MLTLRDYQTAAVEAFWQYFKEGKTGNPIIALPTGTGKSLINSSIIQSSISAYPSTRILCLTHVKELIEGNYNSLLTQWPTAPAGVYSAGLRRRDLNAPVTFAGIASIYKRAKLFSNTDLILIDECHLVSEQSTGRYLQFINSVKAYNPHLKVIGLSATPFRMGLGHLVDGKLFTDVCFDLTSGEAFVWMIEQGYLSPIIPKRTGHVIDTDDVSLSMGDFSLKSLNEEMSRQGIVEKALNEAIKTLHDRKHWLIFAPSIEQCDQIAAYLSDKDIPTVSIHSKISPQDRDSRINEFVTGQARAAVNQNILTTGFDFPGIDAIVMLRPTRSPGLWVQMLGRGTRPVFAPGSDIGTVEGRLEGIASGPKQNCIVLDFAGNTRRLGPINYPEMPKRRRRGTKGTAPVKECPDCSTYVHARVMICPDCGHKFKPPERLQMTADTAPLVESRNREREAEAIVFPVDRMAYNRHKKVGKPDSVRVDYYSGFRRFSEWVGVEHTGFMRQRAQRWWRQHSSIKGEAIPTSVDELLDDFTELVRQPTHIRVLMTHPFPRIEDYDFTGKGFEYTKPTGPVDSGGSNGTRSSPPGAPIMFDV